MSRSSNCNGDSGEETIGREPILHCQGTHTDHFGEASSEEKSVPGKSRELQSHIRRVMNFALFSSGKLRHSP